MDPSIELPFFKVVVTDKSTQWLGDGATRKKSERCIYYYAEKNEEDGLFVQPLNGSNIPSGDKIVIDDVEFCKRFKPEPLVFYNKVIPAMEQLESSLGKAERHRAADRLDKAQAAYQEVLALDAVNVGAIFGMGLVALAKGDTEEAEEIFKQLMDLEFPLEGKNKHLFNEFGIKLRRNNMLSQAIEWYKKALGCSSGDSHLYCNMARVQLELGQFDQAEEALQAALRLEPNLEPAAKLLSAVTKAKARHMPETAKATAEAAA